jgi:hypothetical protein
VNLDRIRSRQRPWVDYKLLAVDGEQLAAAQKKATEAAGRLRQAILREDPDKPERVKELAAARRAQARADKAMLACWESIRLTALPPDEYEQLKAANPPTGEELAADKDAEWSTAALRPALLAACAEGGLSVDEWQTLLDERFSVGERHEIFTTALAINESSRVVESVVLPKGSTGMTSSLLNLR